ncbi:MAG: acetyl-CoA decarbonylase/synthase complex subunit gamma [Planctomycetota bacterium]|nr:MAG: acetyl-CoA decarbonylase/synthase complex subunit gamma [Planctomycetota bacterium]
MAMTGLEIFKLLPKTNCKDCGKPTCLAFAMALAQKKASLDECPEVSDEAKTALSESAAPPIKKVTVGAGDKALSAGEETVLYRHEEKFYHPTAIAVTVDDADAEADARLEKAKKLNFIRVGLPMELNAVAVTNSSGDAGKFVETAKKADSLGLPLVLISDSADNLKAAGEALADKKPLLAAARDEAGVSALAPLSKEKGLPIVVEAGTIDALADLVEKAKAAGAENIFLSFGKAGPRDAFENLTKLRRLALRKGFRTLGFPIFTDTRVSEDVFEAASAAAISIAKYGGVLVTDLITPEAIYPLMTLRQNIYTDPQKPIQVEPRLYKVGDADENSPLFFTTNFSLTYFSVEGDVEASRIPSWILAVDTEGTSVLTAYSGDKLNEKVVAQAFQKCEVEKHVKHKKLIIPGHVAVMSGKLEEALPGWTILVGPKESSYIPRYIQDMWK